MSEEVPETADGAIRGWIVAVGFTLVLIGGELMAERDGVRFWTGFGLAVASLPCYLSAVWWQTLRPKLDERFLLTLKGVATDARWWVGGLFIVLAGLIFTPVVDQWSQWLKPSSKQVTATADVNSESGDQTAQRLQQLEAVSAHIASIQTDLQKHFNMYVRPRAINDDQKKIAIAYLLPRQHFDIEIVFNHEDEEANQFASMLYGIFNEAEWRVAMTDAANGRLPGGSSLPQGLNYRVVVGSEPKGGKPIDLIYRAFQEAEINDMGGGSSSGTPATAQQPDDKIMLLVGHRPMVIRQHTK